MSDTTLLEAIRNWEPPSPEELTSQIPGVSVERLIARGGMAAVYLARQQSLDRAVALKVLPPELGRIEGFNERFESEARVLARLHHPGIVTVFDFGRTPTGSDYIIMEFVSGESLGRWAQGKPFAEKLAVAIRVIEGVAYLHHQGIVHADLKPDNVLVEPDGHVRILDFGLATPFRSDRRVEAPRFGTPPYTAPEAYQTDAQPDPRSDVFSLGQTLCEFFSECPPLADPNPASLAAQLGHRELAAAIGPMVRLQPAERANSLDDVLTTFQRLRTPPRGMPAARPRPLSAPAEAPKPKRSAWKYAASFVAVIAVAIALREGQRPDPTPVALPPAAVVEAPTVVVPAVVDDATSEAEAIFREAAAAATAEADPPAPPVRSPTPGPPTDPIVSTAPPEPPPTATDRPAPPPADPKVRGLNEKFIAALVREREGNGDPAAVASLGTEIDRMTREQSVPETDPPELPELVLKLRTIYREQLAKLAPPTPSVASAAPAPAPPGPIYAPFDDPVRASTSLAPTPPALTPPAPTPPRPADPSLPKARITLFWRCADRAVLLLNGNSHDGESARGNEFGPKIWKSELEIAAGDVLGFKLHSNGGERDFSAVAKVHGRVLFVVDSKWQTFDGEPPADWWTGVDKRGTEPRKLNSREYNNRLVQDFSGFVEVPRGNILPYWGENPVRSNIRRIVTKFDVQTALGVAAR